MSTIVHTFEHEALVAGLSWSVLRTDGDEQKSHQDGKKIRRQAALLGASAYCQQVANQALYLGLYSAGLLQKNKNRKKIYSLALAFSLHSFRFIHGCPMVTQVHQQQHQCFWQVFH